MGGEHYLRQIEGLTDPTHLKRHRFSRADLPKLRELCEAVNYIVSGRWNTRPELANLLQDFLNEQGFTGELHRSESAAPNNGGEPESNRPQPTGDTGASSARAAFNAGTSSKRMPAYQYFEGEIITCMSQFIRTSHVSYIAQLLKITSQELRRRQEMPEDEQQRLHPLYREIREIIDSNTTEQHQRGRGLYGLRQRRNRDESIRMTPEQIETLKSEFRRLLNIQPQQQPSSPGLTKNGEASPTTDFAHATAPSQNSAALEALDTNCKILLNLMRRYLGPPDRRSKILKDIQTRTYIPNALRGFRQEYLTIFTDLRDAMLRAAKLETEGERVRAFKRILNRSKTESYGLKTTTPPRGSGPGASWNP